MATPMYDTPIGTGGKIDNATGVIQSGALAGQQAGTSLNGYTVTPINSTNTAPQSNIKLPNPPPTPNYGAAMTGAAATMASNAASSAPTMPTDTTGSADMTALFNKYMGANTAPPSLEEQYNADYATTGIDAKQAAYNQSKQKFDAINAQIQGLTAQGEAAKLGIAEQAAPQFLISGQQAAVDRSVAIKAIPLQIQALAVQAEMTGNQNILDQAQTHLDTLFKIHSDDAQAQYQYKTDTLKTVYNFLTDQEKRKADALQKTADYNHDFTLQTIKQASDYSSTALKSGQSDLSAKISGLDPRAPDYAQQVAALGAQVVDKGAALDLQAKRASIANTYSEINTRNATAAETGTISSKLKATRGADGYVDPSVYANLRATAKMSAAEFDNRFGNLVNPASTARLGIGTTATGTGFAPSASDTSAVMTELQKNPSANSSVDLNRLKTDQQYFYWVKAQLGV